MAACSDGDAPAPQPSEFEPPPAGQNAPPKRVPSAEGGGADPSDGGGTGAHVESGDRDESDEPPTATTITGVWPDQSWQIEELEGDACADRAPQISRWVLGKNYFSCGATEDLLIACKQVQGDEALCVRDPLEKTAVRIRSPAIDGFTAPAPEDPLPLMVVLAEGSICTPVPRDSIEHHAGRQSWLYCGENSALLLDITTANSYFDPSGEVWTADLGVGGAAPTVVEVREIIYAGTPEDVEAQGFRAG
ncbi:hypothetical protein [uncultured Brachybacterium sp.]|uniref:hypothetical protein n=1 Tax=uncultured Brachybacterium sp. TaxID=189680 RepID=UPI002614E86B|nr:hypothetical protein [uncultured Brachybacterium sp.]